MLITFCIILIMLISKVWIMDSCLAHASFSLLHTTLLNIVAFRLQWKLQRILWLIWIY